jgi:hypothetical protein
MQDILQDLLKLQQQQLDMVHQSLQQVGCPA